MSLSAGTRKFDLYDFFSVLLPGVAFLLAVFPFLPDGSKLGSVGLIIPLVFGGFIVGRAIHAIASEIEASLERYPTHRERFYREISQGDALHPETVACFLDQCEQAFDIDNVAVYFDAGQDDQSQSLPAKIKAFLARNLLGLGPQRAKRDGPESDLYALVRSYIHIDGRGRSRTFQAIYSFYRSMWITTALIAIIYLLYAVLKAEGLLASVIDYTSFIGASGVDYGIVTIVCIFIFLLAHFVFSTTRAEFQRYFVQYLITDFIVLRRTD